MLMPDQNTKELVVFGFKTRNIINNDIQTGVFHRVSFIALMNKRYKGENKSKLRVSKLGP